MVTHGLRAAASRGVKDMTSFDDRKKGFEDKFKHDQETLFKIAARRNKLLGLWAAEHLGLQGDAAEAYAKEVVAADFEKPGDEDVIGKVVKDLSAKNAGITEAQVRDRFQRCAAEARKQIAGQ
jgi:hypothetical protein